MMHFRDFAHIAQVQPLTKRGDWFQTYTGKAFYPWDPRPEEICIEDIARGLSHICRFNGHCREFYSVAQHSILVAQHCPIGLALTGLLHDATEAYLGDLVRPFKRGLPGYKEAEQRLWEVIAGKWNLHCLDGEVKYLDNCALMTERRDLLSPPPNGYRWGTEAFPPFPEKIKPLAPEIAEARFLMWFQQLTRGF